MSLSSFIPQLWEASFLKSFEKEIVIASCMNQNYSGMIKNAGDTVKILELDEPTITAYIPGTSTLTPETLTGSTQELKIDKSYSACFKVNSVDLAQSAPKTILSEYTRKAARGLKNVLEVQLAALYAEAGSAVGTALSPIDLKSDNLLETIGAVGEALSETDTPMAGRFLICPAWMITKFQIAKAELETANSAILSNGLVGRYLGFDVYCSRNISETSDGVCSKILAGVKDAWTLAVQIQSTTAYEVENDFAQAIKMLFLYGYKVTSPAQLCVLYADYTAE